MSAEDKFHAKYSNYLADFKTLSFDKTNDESLCQNTTHQYYNFDKIVKARNNELTPASPDTIILKNNKVYCVEFKNSFQRRINAKKIKKKLTNGHQVLLEIFQELDLQHKEYRFIFCVVHKGFNETVAEKQNKRWEKLHRNIHDKRTTQFGLEQYKGKGKYFDDIITNDVDFFRKQFIQKINKNLPC